MAQKSIRNYSFLSMFRKYTNSSVILMVVTILALVVANSRYGGIYRNFWEQSVSFSIGEFNLFSHHSHDLSLMDFINDFLMAIFFFSVGLEIKREVLVGELSSIRKALLPIIGACGGMILPVLLFYIICPNDALMLRGAAIPMATDIAFSLGVLSMFNKRVPIGLKIFLATLAVADDLGGIIVIASCYSTGIDWQYMGIAAALMLVLMMGNLRHVVSKTFYIVFGIGIWYCFLNSGIHATIAGVIVALFVPARPSVTALCFVDNIRDKIQLFPINQGRKNRHGITILSNEQISMLKNIEHMSDSIISPLQDLEDALQNPINYFVVPIFAFANAGVNFDGIGLENVFSGVALSVFTGLVLGKFIGVFSFSWLAVKLRWVELPEGANWKSFASVCMLTGIGFTVSMFIAGLSYHNMGANSMALLNEAKIGILLGSVTAGFLGILLLHKNLPSEEAMKEHHFDEELC